MKINFRYSSDYDKDETLESLEMDLNLKDKGYWEIRGFFDTFLAAIGIDNPEEVHIDVLPNAFVSARYPDD